MRMIDACECLSWLKIACYICALNIFCARVCLGVEMKYETYDINRFTWGFCFGVRHVCVCALEILFIFKNNNHNIKYDDRATLWLFDWDIWEYKLEAPQNVPIFDTRLISSICALTSHLIALLIEHKHLKLTIDYHSAFFIHKIWNYFFVFVVVVVL